MNGSTDVRGVVVDPAFIHFPDGRVRPAGTLAWMPAVLLAGPELAQHATIVVDGVSIPEHDRDGAAVRAAGWTFSKVDAWTTYHQGDRTVSIGLRDEMGPQHLGQLVTRETDPGVLAMLLQRYADALGSTWRGTPATSALAALRLSWGNTRGEPLWKFGSVGAGIAGAGPMVWERPLNDDERTWGFVHTFDANKSYLAAAINAEVARSELVHAGVQPFDPKLPGYWLVELDPATRFLLDQPGRPPLLGRTLRDGCAWVTTPIGKLLMELGDRCEVLDSWTGRNHAGATPAVRVFRKLGERIRDALTLRAPHPVVAAAIKQTYKDLPGALQRETMRVYRPDWAHTIIDLARANLYRRMMRIRTEQGVWPCRVMTDSLSYADCTEAVGVWRTALPIGPQLGHFKHERVWSTQDWLNRRNGQGWK